MTLVAVLGDIHTWRLSAIIDYLWQDELPSWLLLMELVLGHSESSMLVELMSLPAGGPGDRTAGSCLAPPFVDVTALSRPVPRCHSP